MIVNKTASFVELFINGVSHAINYGDLNPTKININDHNDHITADNNLASSWCKIGYYICSMYQMKQNMSVRYMYR